MVSAKPFSVDLVEYQDKFDNQQLISSDGYYSVPTGNKTTINAFNYSATYPFADAKKITREVYHKTPMIIKFLL